MNDAGDKAQIRIAPATKDDVGLVLRFVRELAEYEKLAHEVVASEADIRDSLFGARAHAEALIARGCSQPIGLALFFHNYSTFLGRPGLYVEDVYVVPAWRRRGVGRQFFAHMAQIAIERRCGRMEWSVLDWNEPALRFYRGLGAVGRTEWTVQRLKGDDLHRLAAEAT
jgi:GNAT superfamily N-acetyltransferase